jgi:hypothetical protein
MNYFDNNGLIGLRPCFLILPNYNPFVIIILPETYYKYDRQIGPILILI